MSFVNKTFDNTNPLFSYFQSQFWVNGPWVGGASNDSLTWIRGLPVNITFDFPEPAIAFYYYGVPSDQKIQVCIDCDVDPGNVDFIGGVPADSSKDVPPTSLIYSMQFDQPDFHTVKLSNQPLQDSFSVITLDRIDFEVPNGPVSSNSTTTHSSTSSGASSTTQPATSGQVMLTSSGASSGQVTPTPSGTSFGQLTPTPSATSGQSQNHVGAIVGGVIGGLAGLVALFALWYLIRRRIWIRRSTDEKTHTITGSPIQPEFSEAPFDNRFSVIHGHGGGN